MTKIFNMVWHLAHQDSLLRIPDTQWSWLINHRRSFSETPRGDMISKYGIEQVTEYKEGKYDVAVLHLDQQCFETELWERGKGSVFRDLNILITDIPKICIMHGTPYYPEYFAIDIMPNNYKEMGYTEKQIGMSSVVIDKFKEAVKDCSAIIFNSHRAKEQWGFEDDPRAYTIWHGMETTDWLDLTKEPRVVTMISPGGLDKYYDRAFMSAVREELLERNIVHCHITVDVQFKSFDEYRKFLGRSLVYFHPSKESPMPRSRTEAMLSGCCVVTTPHQDADMFIKTGENGIIVPRNPKVTADIIEGLIYEYKTAVKIGQAGKETATELFGIDRYIKDWNVVLNNVLKK
jgi:hypothetical protein